MNINEKNALVPKFSATLIIEIIAVLIVAHITINWVKRAFLQRKLGTKTVTKVERDGWMGFKLLGELLKMRREGTITDHSIQRFNRLDTDTFKFSLAGVSLVYTKDPENIKALLATQFEDFSLGIRHSTFKPLLGDGIFTLDGSGWKHSRTMLRPQFAREQVAHVKLLEPHVQMLAKQIRKYNHQKFDIQELFFRLTVDSATEFLFGESVESLNDGTVATNRDFIDFDGKAGFAEAFNNAQAWIATRNTFQKLGFLVNNKEFRESVAHVHRFTDYFVNSALELSLEELDKKSRNGYIFLYELAKQTRNPKVLRDQLLNIMLAGRDTTAGLLSFTFFELARNPDIWEKLKEEIYTKFGSGDESRVEDITFESLKKCEYLKAILNEALRLYPSVPQNFRYSTRDTSLPKGGGPDGQSPIFIPKSQTVVYSVYSTQRDPKYYGKDANVFRPERWLGPETRKLGWAYLPFNGGPRICLGQQFALTEASYVVTRLAQMFPNLRSFDDKYPPKKNVTLTMSHFDGVFVGM